MDDRRWGMALAILAALLVVAAASFLPLQPIIAGDEAYASKTIQTNRDNASTASKQFLESTQSYRTYIKTHDLGALLINAREAITQAKSAPENANNLTAVKDAAAQVIDYAGVLQSYAQAGETYFSALKAYDEKLMSWTRSLGAKSEQLRSATFPFVEHLKNYPPPIGLKADPPMVNARQVGKHIAVLPALMTQLGPNANPANDAQTTLTLMDRDLSSIWEDGRSVEYVNGLHDTYYAQLQTYDSKVQEAANEKGDKPQSVGYAWLWSLLFVVCTIMGVMWLFAPNMEKVS